MLVALCACFRFAALVWWLIVCLFPVSLLRLCSTCGYWLLRWVYMFIAFDCVGRLVCLVYEFGWFTRLVNLLFA